MNKNTCYLYSVCVNQIKVPLFSFQNFQRSNKRSCKDQASVTTRWQSRDILLENALHTDTPRLQDVDRGIHVVCL